MPFRLPLLTLMEANVKWGITPTTNQLVQALGPHLKDSFPEETALGPHRLPAPTFLYHRVKAPALPMIKGEATTVSTSSTLVKLSVCKRVTRGRLPMIQM